jgi:hypothetical protein
MLGVELGGGSQGNVYRFVSYPPFLNMLTQQRLATHVLPSMDETAGSRLTSVRRPAAILVCSNREFTGQATNFTIEKEILVSTTKFLDETI